MHQYLVDISPISSLTNLVHLNINGKGMECDLNPLASLENLRQLAIWGDDGDGEVQGDHLEVISQLTNLTHLNLSGNSQIGDLSPLSRLTNLELLDLHWDTAMDITPISNLFKLKTLKLGNEYEYSAINDLSPLANLTEMKDLDLGANGISDISPLSRMMNLKELELYGNNIEEIEPLTKFPQLEYLGLDGNPIFGHPYYDYSSPDLLLIREMRTRPNPVRIDLQGTQLSVYTNAYPEDEDYS